MAAFENKDPHYSLWYLVGHDEGECSPFTSVCFAFHDVSDEMKYRIIAKEKHTSFANDAIQD